MKAAFLDANVLFSAALDPQGHVAAALKRSGAKLVTSPYAIEEARRNLSEAEFPALSVFLETVELAHDSFGPLPPGVELVAKDVPVLASAIAADADFLITGDAKHFGRFFGKTICGVRILRVRDLAAAI
jgi:predicted nucleic acid-binding protein